MTDSAWDGKLGRVAKALSETFDSTAEAASKAAANAQRWGTNGRDTLEDVVVAGKDDLVKAAKAAASSAKEPTQTLAQLRDAISAGAAAAKEAALKAKSAASVAYANRNQIASDAVDAVTGAAQRAAAD